MQNEYDAIVRTQEQLDAASGDGCKRIGIVSPFKGNLRIVGNCQIDIIAVDELGRRVAPPVD